MIWVALAGPAANFVQALAVARHRHRRSSKLGVQRAVLLRGRQRRRRRQLRDLRVQSRSGAAARRRSRRDGRCCRRARRSRTRASSRTASSSCMALVVDRRAQRLDAADRRRAATARCCSRSADASQPASFTSPDLLDRRQPPHGHDRVLSGMRPTGAMHIGHYHGALKNWVRLQDEYPCFFFVADWHALTTAYDEVDDHREERVGHAGRLARGRASTPSARRSSSSRACIEHAELTLLLGMTTPLGWLERMPTYKDQIEKLVAQGPDDVRLPRLSVDAVGRHPDLPRALRAGRRGPGAAHRDHARGRAALQPPVRPRAGLRGQGQGGRRRSSARADGRTFELLQKRYGEAGRRGRARRGAPAAREREEPRRRPTASGCSATSPDRSARSSSSPRRC